MARRYDHVGKSSQDKEQYVKHLAALSGTSTAEESFKFPESDNLEKDLSIPSTGGKRPKSAINSIRDHIRANWPVWATAVLLTLAIIYAVDFNSRLGSMENTLDNIEDRIQDQEIRLIEQTFRIDYLERILGK